MPSDQLTGLESPVSAESSKPRTGLVTLLFTDTVGSTALKQQLGDQGGALLFRKHHQLVRELLARFPTGQEIETAGDSFLMIFATPSDAVRFALQLQSTLRQWREKGGVGLQDRVGIHVGEVVVEGDQSGVGPRELYGIQIDTCSRVMSLAKGGQVLLSRGALDSARQVLKGEDIPGVGPLQWLNYGPYLLKGLDDPLEICEVREAGQPDSGPPTSSDKAERQVSPDGEPVLGWRPALGQIVPNTRWTLESKLGEGGFGEVWLGRHQTMKERRVFKFCFRADRARSLKREMTLFRLIKERIGDHPNIVSLREVSFDQPPFYVEMDYVEGQDLRTWSEARGGLGRMPLDVKLEIVAQVADGLQAAHDAGVIHRDVKPANILIQTRGGPGPETHAGGSLSHPNEAPGFEVFTAPGGLRARLTDFGIGQVISQEHLAGMTGAGFTVTLLGSQSGSPTGTQLYMAPELLAGKPATTRSDIYSLGVVLYQMSVGDFSRPLTVDWASRIEDPLLRADLARCFAGEIGERFGSAAELARHLRHFQERRAEQQRQHAEKEALERAAYRLGILRTAGVAAVIVAVIAGLALAARSQSKRASQNAKEASARAESLRRHLYCSDMAVAWHALDEGDVERTRALLTNQLRTAGQGVDLRGFEWRYLWARSRPRQLFVIPVPGFSVRFSKEGRRVAIAGGFEGGVTLWDIVSRSQSRPIQAYPAEGWGLDFSEDGKLLATTSRKAPDFKVWNAETGNLMDSLPGNTQENVRVAISPDGKRLATVACTPYQLIPAEIKIWDLTSHPARELKSLPGLTSWATHADFSTDSKTLAVADGQGLVRLWDWASGDVRLLTGHSGYAAGLRFSPDGRLLVTGDQNGTIVVWNWTAGTVLRVLTGHHGPINELAVSPDSNWVVSASRDHTARLWDLETGEELARFLGHPGRVWSLDLSPDGRTLATAGQDGIRFWSTIPNRDGEILARTEFNPNLGYSPDGRWIFLDEWGTNRVTLFDAASKTNAQTLAGRDINFSSDGRVLTLITGESNVVIYARPTLQRVGAIPGRGRLTGQTAISPDGKFLIVRREGKPVVMDLSEQRELVALDSGSGHNLALTADGKTLIAEEEGGVRVWDAATWRPSGWLCSPSNGVERLALSGDGTLVATASGQTVRLWNLRTRTAAENPVLGQAGSGINSLAFSPDGRNVAAGTFDGPIHLWNVPGGQEVGSFKLHRSIVRGLAFSPDGRSLISQSYDGTVRLWTALATSELAAP